MLIRQNLRFTRILKYTWKMHVGLLVTCTILFLVDKHLLPQTFEVPATAVTLLGTALAFFVGFTNNQSYGRWWEARIIWGAIVNNSRNWARSVAHYIRPGNLDDVMLESIKHKMIRRQIAFVYSLKGVLRNANERYFEKYLSPQDILEVRRYSNVPNAILDLNARDLMELLDRGSIDEYRFVQMDKLLNSITDHMGKSERIRNTVFPTSYIYFTQVFIWVLVAFITLSLADPIGSWSILMGCTTGAVFHITHKNGMGLVNPFDDLPTGIPLNQISRNIEIDLLQTLSEKEIPEPVKPENGEYVL